MSEIRVRPYEPRDAEAVHEVMTSPGVVARTLQVPYQPLEEVRERFGRREPGLYSLVAEVDGRLVGTLTLRVERSPRRRHAAAFGMGVHDAYQGRGVGTALMAAMVDLADNWLGIHRIQLEVYTDNAAAIHLYEKFGFAVEGTLRDFALRDGAYVDAYVMARLRPGPA